MMMGISPLSAAFSEPNHPTGEQVEDRIGPTDPPTAGAAVTEKESSRYQGMRVVS